MSCEHESAILESEPNLDPVFSSSQELEPNWAKQFLEFEQNQTPAMKVLSHL